MMTEPLFIAFFILQIADIYTTHNILKKGGRGLNPVMAKAFDHFGVLPSLLVVKTLVVLMVYNFVVPYSLILIGLCVLYAGVVGHNFYQLQKGN